MSHLLMRSANDGTIAETYETILHFTQPIGMTLV